MMIVQVSTSDLESSSKANAFQQKFLKPITKTQNGPGGWKAIRPGSQDTGKPNSATASRLSSLQASQLSSLVFYINS
jgi:hypothetical protein